MSSDAAAPRRYRSTRRVRQAQQTRTDVLLAAARLFARGGYAGTTVAAIAAEAGVAVETVYAGFGSKKALLGAAMDVAIVGDAEPVPLMAREHTRLALEAPRDERLPRIVAVIAQVYGGSVVGVWSAMLEAAASDPEVARWCDEHEQRRWETSAEILQAVLEYEPVREAVDGFWALSSLEVYAKLTRQRGWSRQQWQDSLVTSVQRLFTAA